MGVSLPKPKKPKKPKLPKDAKAPPLRKQRQRAAEGRDYRLGHELTKKEDLYVTVEIKKKIGRGPSAREVTKSQRIQEPRLVRCWRQTAEAVAQRQELGDDAGGSEEDVFARRAAEMRAKDRAEGRGKARKSQSNEYNREWTHLENFILTTKPSTDPDYQLVDNWRKGDATFGRPISHTTLEIYLRHLSSPKTTQIIPGVFGRGLGYESVCMAKKAVVHFHQGGCRVPQGSIFVAPNKSSYIEHPDVMTIVHDMAEEHDPESAPEFEFVAGVKAMRIAVFQNPTTTHLQKLYQWAVIMMSLNHMLRKSDMCDEHCPDAVTIETPNDMDEWDVESELLSCPQSFTWICHKWKAPASHHCKPHRLRTTRNLISPLYCPMLAYLDFAASTSLTYAIALEQGKPQGERTFVAMFPALTAGGIDPSTPATCNMMDSLLLPVLRDAFPQMAPNIPTPHSLRAVGLIWYLRCQIAEKRSQLAGRWLAKNANSWGKYVRGGSEEAAKWRAKNQLDPVYYFWCATDSFVAYIQSGE